jgi:tRNA pseudouridine32 synthase/23S rRNA pseudouridine746 synthase
LSVRVQHHFAQALVVHRLDMATSGLLVMARNSEVQKRLNAAFAAREVHKRYMAVVQGACGTDMGVDATYTWHTIDLPILVDWPCRPLRKIDHDHGKPSTTRWRRVAHDADADTTRLELEPLTGRSHQLRVHLQALGHPILGDALYAPQAVAQRSARLLLHATELALAHPLHGEPLHFHCPCPF